jgi:alpha-1,2-glucosyltransferase
MTAKKSICEFAIEICVVLSFVAFVILNGSIVLGDKSNHESSFHPTQLLYLALFCVINLPLGVLQYVHYLRATIAQSKLRFLVISIIGAAIVAKFTIVHKFILADNRHYMFYIWKNLYAKFEFFRYAMVPVYAASMAFIMQIFRGNEIAEVKLMLLFVCSAVVLIPAGLVEVRYFTSSLCFLIIEVAQMVARNDTLNN